MRTRLYIVRSVAFFLLLVFLQKSGAGLYLHSLFHGAETQSLSQENRELSYACTCVDDFFLPFEPAAETVVPSPVFNYAPGYVESFTTVPSQLSPYSSLRGPPAVL